MAFFEAAYRLGNDCAYVMIDRRPGYSLSFESYNDLCSSIQQYCAAVACIADSPVDLAVAALWIERLAQHVRARMFENERGASAWLLELREADRQGGQSRFCTEPA